MAYTLQRQKISFMFMAMENLCDQNKSMKINGAENSYSFVYANFKFNQKKKTVKRKSRSSR